MLGIPRHAGPDEVRAAYRRLARRYHPDVSTEPDAARRFAELAEAYEQLSGQGVIGPAQARRGPPDAEHAADVYDAFFRADAPPRARHRPPFEPVPGTPHLALVLPLEPAEAAAGTVLTVPTPDGPRQLVVPAGTADGRELRIPRVVPVRRGSPGDLIVRVRIAPASGASVPE